MRFGNQKNDQKLYFWFSMFEFFLAYLQHTNGILIQNSDSKGLNLDQTVASYKGELYKSTDFGAIIYPVSHLFWSHFFRGPFLKAPWKSLGFWKPNLGPAWFEHKSASNCWIGHH